MASEYTNEKANQKKREDFPPTHHLESGAAVVGLALEIRRGVETQYGERDVLHIVTREDESTLRTLWWPRRLPLPNLNTPFYLKRLTEKAYRLLLPETEEEQKELWKTGEVPPEAHPVDGKAPAVGAGVSKILAKFKT